MHGLSIIQRRGEKRKKGKKNKLYKKKKTRRQESTGGEKLNDRMKTANYKPEILTTIELFFPMNQIYGTL